VIVTQASESTLFRAPFNISPHSRKFQVGLSKKNDLAENSNDEKQIFSAERRARSTLSIPKNKSSTSFAASKGPSLIPGSVPSTSMASTQQQPPAV